MQRARESYQSFSPCRLRYLSGRQGGIGVLDRCDRTEHPRRFHIHANASDFLMGSFLDLCICFLLLILPSPSPLPCLAILDVSCHQLILADIAEPVILVSELSRQLLFVRLTRRCPDDPPWLRRKLS